MPKLSEFERYIKQLCDVLGHRDRHGGFADYSRGLMLPIERKETTHGLEGRVSGAPEI
jgi:SRSO17 transposase